jgi:hypothetical protein
MLYPSLHDRLKNQYTSIGIILAGVDRDHLFKKPDPEKWSAHDNVAHLVKYQPVFIDRIHSILKKDGQVFERYKAEDDPEFKIYQDKPTQELLKILTDDREKIYKLITRLHHDELNRIGIHKKFGSLTIVQWTEFFLLHEAHHIFTVFQLVHPTEE